MDPVPALLLHGQPGAAADWSAVVELLSAAVRPIAFDRPGYGANPRPAGSFTPNAHAVLDELDARGIDQAVLVGYSYGGGVALATATIAPERVRGLVLVSAVGPGCLNGWDHLLGAPVAGPVCAVFAWGLTPWAARWWIARAERIRRRPLEPAELINVHAWATAHHEHGRMWRTFLVEQRALLHDLDELVAALPTIAAPTLLLADPADTVVPIRTARELARLLPNARLVEMTGAGHHLPLRRPAAVAEAISDFAASVPA